MTYLSILSLLLLTTLAHDRQDSGISIQFNGKSHEIWYQFEDTSTPEVYTVHIFLDTKELGKIPNVISIHPRITIDLGKESKPEEALVITVETPEAIQIWTVGRYLRKQHETAIPQEASPNKI